MVEYVLDICHKVHHLISLDRIAIFDLVYAIVFRKNMIKKS
jgi:hypothetical protein